MKISIAMCTYCGAPFVREQLASIAAQTLLPDELVVSDDRSSDATTAIIREFASDAPFRVHLHTNDKNLGVVKNFEKAIELCEADVIALCDQDDVWLPTKLQHLAHAFKGEPEPVMVFTNAYVTDEGLYPSGSLLWECVKFGPREQRMVQDGRAFGLLLRRDIVTGATMAFRSEMRKLILPLPYPSRRLHDASMALMMAAVGELRFINKPLMKYRQHSRQQVGIGSARGLRHKQSGADPQTSTQRHRLIAHELEVMRDRLLAYSDGSLRRDIVCLLDTHITHMRARADMPTKRWGRLAVVLRELFAFRYHRCSTGLKSATKDMLVVRPAGDGSNVQ